MAFHDELRAVALTAMNRLSVPGAAIGVISTERRDICTLGVTALDTQFEVRSDTLFQVGSVSKPFTATLLVTLKESGRLDLDAPVTDYIPDLQIGKQSAVAKIKVRHLLTHQAGFWGDWFEDFGLGDDAIERFVAEYGRLPQQFEPGTMWAYNNCGYILAGLVASRVTGKTFEDALREFVLDPLDLDHTVQSAAEAIAYPAAVGHTNDPEDGTPEIARQYLRPRARNPAGGVLASIEDVLTFAEFHLGKQDGPVSNAGLEAMREPQVGTHEAGVSWGLGFRIEQRDGAILVGHGGATNGFRADLTLVPDREFSVAVLTNSDSGSRFTGEIVDWVLERHLGIVPVEHKTVDLSESDRERFAGVYDQPYGSIEVQPSDDGLRGRMTTDSPYSERTKPHTGPWFGLRHIGDGRFVVADGDLKDAQIKIWTWDDGSVRYLQAGGRLYVPGTWDALERSHG
ncbi:hypothetical protein BH23CHL2_BH23CHL2_00630 [soil metagenome]